MKKFSTMSNDIKDLNDKIDKEIKDLKLDGEWEIVNVIDVTTNEPIIKEALIINAELGNKTVKRGDIIWITALLKKKDQSDSFHQSQMGVLKVRVSDIYNTISILNSVK